MELEGVEEGLGEGQDIFVHKLEAILFSCSRPCSLALRIFFSTGNQCPFRENLTLFSSVSLTRGAYSNSSTFNTKL